MIRPIRVDHNDFFKWLLKLIHSLIPKVGWKDRWFVLLEVGSGQWEGTQRSQRPWPTRGTCTETTSKHHSLPLLVSVVGCSRPSSLLSPEASTGGLKEDPPRSGKNAVSWWWVLVVSFIPLHTVTVKLTDQTKSGHACLGGPLFARFWPPTVAVARPERCKNCTQVLFRRVLTWPSTWWLIVCPEKQGHTRENCRFVDFGGGDCADGLWTALRSMVRPKRCTTTCFDVCLTCTRLSGQDTPPINRHALWLLSFWWVVLSWVLVYKWPVVVLILYGVHRSRS